MSNNLVNCYECVFKDKNNARCRLHNVRIYPNLNNPKYALGGYYYPCQQCKGTDFKSKIEENREVPKKSNINNEALDFVKRLASETFMSIGKSKELVGLIFNNGYLEEAIDAYNEQGIAGLANYIYPQFYAQEKKEMKFELGKYYQHTTGSKIHICGLGETYHYGRCFIGENEYGELTPIGSSEDNAVNYHEIIKDDFIGRKSSPIVDELMNLLKARRITLIPMDRCLIDELNSIKGCKNE